MFPRAFRPYPNQTRSMLYTPAPFGLFGGALFLCGLIAIGSFVAPSAVEQAIPGWHERLGVVVIIGVVLGFLRSIWRLVVPITAVMFWLVAGLCLWKPDVRTFSEPFIGLTAPSSKQAQQPLAQPAYLSAQKSLPPALPDTAYFAPRSSADSIARGVNSFMRKVMH